MSVKNANCLSAKGLHKQYGSRMVVKNVDISVKVLDILFVVYTNGGESLPDPENTPLTV